MNTAPVAYRAPPGIGPAVQRYPASACPDCGASNGQACRTVVAVGAAGMVTCSPLREPHWRRVCAAEAAVV